MEILTGFHLTGCHAGFCRQFNDAEVAEKEREVLNYIVVHDDTNNFPLKESKLPLFKCQKSAPLSVLQLQAHVQFHWLLVYL